MYIYSTQSRDSINIRISGASHLSYLYIHVYVYVSMLDTIVLDIKMCFVITSTTCTSSDGNHKCARNWSDAYRHILVLTSYPSSPFSLLSPFSPPQPYPLGLGLGASANPSPRRIDYNVHVYFKIRVKLKVSLPLLPGFPSRSHHSARWCYAVLCAITETENSNRNGNSNSLCNVQCSPTNHQPSK